MKTDRSISLVVAGLGLLAAVVASGCGNKVSVDTKGWQDVGRAYADAYSGRGSERDWAVQRAREAAVQSGLTVEQLDKYTITPTKGDNAWWVDFRYLNSEKTHWPERFVIRVDADGKTRSYHYADAPAH